MDRRYIKLFRKIRESGVWAERRVFSRAEAWIDLLMEAHHDREKPRSAIISGHAYEVGYGQMLWLIRYMANRWQWSKSKVSRFLEWLKNEDSIETATGTVTMHITIRNYGTYNDGRNGNRDSNGTKRGTATGHQRDKRKNLKNLRKEERKGPLTQPSPPVPQGQRGQRRPLAADGIASFGGRDRSNDECGNVNDENKAEGKRSNESGKRSKVSGKRSEAVAQNPAKSPVSSDPEPQTSPSHPGPSTSSPSITHHPARKHCGGRHSSPRPIPRFAGLRGQALIIPHWLDARVWEDFKAHRAAMKAKMTPQAERLIVARLEELKGRGCDPKEVLLQSIERGWKGVFEVHGPGGRPPHSPASRGTAGAGPVTADVTAAFGGGRPPVRNNSGADPVAGRPVAADGTAAFGGDYEHGEAPSTMWTEQGLQNLRVAQAYISRMGPTVKSN